MVGSLGRVQHSGWWSRTRTSFEKEERVGEKNGKVKCKAQSTDRKGKLAVHFLDELHCIACRSQESSILSLLIVFQYISIIICYGDQFVFSDGDISDNGTGTSV